MSPMSRYHVDIFPVGMLQCNCSLLMDSQSKTCVVVDPGDEAKLIIEKLENYGVGVSFIWHTHAHIDHIGGTKKLFEAFAERNKQFSMPAPKVYLHPEDSWLYENASMQAQMLGIPDISTTPVTDKIKQGQKYEGFEGLEALHTPGHTPGSCCLRVEHSSDIFAPKSYSVGQWENIPELLFSGDTLFRRSIGRTDLWGGNYDTIEKSIKSKIYTLNPDVVVVPGHGPLTVIEQEQHKNPFVSL